MRVDYATTEWLEKFYRTVASDYNVAVITAVCIHGDASTAIACVRDAKFS